MLIPPYLQHDETCIQLQEFSTATESWLEAKKCIGWRTAIVARQIGSDSNGTRNFTIRYKTRSGGKQSIACYFNQKENSWSVESALSKEYRKLLHKQKTQLYVGRVSRGVPSRLGVIKSIDMRWREMLKSRRVVWRKKMRFERYWRGPQVKDELTGLLEF